MVQAYGMTLDLAGFGRPTAIVRVMGYLAIHRAVRMLSLTNLNMRLRTEKTFDVGRRVKPAPPKCGREHIVRMVIRMMIRIRCFARTDIDAAVLATVSKLKNNI